MALIWAVCCAICCATERGVVAIRISSGAPWLRSAGTRAPQPSGPGTSALPGAEGSGATGLGEESPAKTEILRTATVASFAPATSVLSLSPNCAAGSAAWFVGAVLLRIPALSVTKLPWAGPSKCGTSPAPPAALARWAESITETNRVPDIAIPAALRPFGPCIASASKSGAPASASSEPTRPSSAAGGMGLDPQPEGPAFFAGGADFAERGAGTARTGSSTSSVSSRLASTPPSRVPFRPSAPSETSAAKPFPPVEAAITPDGGMGLLPGPRSGSNMRRPFDVSAWMQHGRKGLPYLYRVTE